MAAIQAANADLEQSLASITAELDSLRSLQAQVARLEAHMAVVCSSEEDRAKEARERASALAAAEGESFCGRPPLPHCCCWAAPTPHIVTTYRVLRCAADGEERGSGEDVAGPVERGRMLVGQAERSLAWAAGPEMSTALPETSAAVRRYGPALWLRDMRLCWAG